MSKEERSKREVLAESPLFENLLPVELTFLSELVQEKNYAAGDTVFHEGDVGQSMFVIATGKVSVQRKKEGGGMQTIATLGAPIFFGEMSLIDKEFRSATIVAESDAELLELTNQNLHTFARNYRNGFTWIVVNIARVLSSRLRDSNKRLAEKK